MSVENIIPIGEYILVKVDTDKQDSSSLIITNVNKADNRGIIKAVGDKVNTDKDSVKLEVGDEVIFIPGNGVSVTNSENSDLLVSVKNIIGKIGE